MGREDTANSPLPSTLNVSTASSYAGILSRSDSSSSMSASSDEVLISGSDEPPQPAAKRGSFTHILPSVDDESLARLGSLSAIQMNAPPSVDARLTTGEETSDSDLSVTEPFASVLFSDLVQSALRKVKEVHMTCGLCASGPASMHAIENRAVRLPATLCIRPKAGEEAEFSSFWRSWSRPLIQGNYTIPALATDGSQRSVAWLVSRWFQLRRQLTETSEGREEFQVLGRVLKEHCNLSRCVLPSLLWAGITQDGDTEAAWVTQRREDERVLDICACSQSTCRKVHAYHLTGVICSVNHLWTRDTKKTLWKIFTEDIAPREGLLPRHRVNQCRDHTCLHYMIHLVHS